MNERASRAGTTRIRVAIDGPAGAGKSTVARGLARRVGYLLLDTGALYRTVALAVTRAGVSFDEAARVGQVARALVEVHAIAFIAGDDDAGGSGMRVSLKGEDVSLLIRSPEMSTGASRVSAVPEVREALLAMQRRAGEDGGVVLEGRDIGTVVLPDAEAKFFLTASAEERARRRFDELTARGKAVSYDETLADVIARDRADMSRAAAPLRRADDAILVDSSGRPVEDVIEQMARVVEERSRG